MTARALRPGGTAAGRRIAFGLFDADGWTWATVKALFWFVLIIILLAYIPDRAYYFTVFPTIDVGDNIVSPVNFCPASNLTLPCPAPAGAILPWEVAPTQLALPAARTDGAVVQSGSTLIYVGGTDGTTAQSTVYATRVTADGNLGTWTAGAALPAPRARAAVAFLGGQVYVIGGADASGAPTDTVYVGTPDSSGAVPSWTASDTLELPAPRDGATVAVAGDGLFLVGGRDASGPTATVWKATLDTTGALQAWKPTTSLPAARTLSGAVIEGAFIYVLGGADAKGATDTVFRGDVASSGTNGTAVSRWAVAGGTAQLPKPRTDASVFTANGTIYVIGGSDGSKPQSQLYWAAPDASGNIASWSHLAQSDLPAAAAISGAAAIASGSHAFLVGGQTLSGPTTSSSRSNLSPQPPFFALGLIGATIPALGIQGEIGQQLGYLAAAGAGTVNFILLVIVGIAFANRERTRELLERLRRRRA